MEDVLIPSGKKECFVLTDRSAESESELVLTVFRFEVQKGRLGSEGTVAKEVKSLAVKIVRTGTRDDVDDRGSGASELRAIVVGVHPEFADHFIRELVR